MNHPHRSASVPFFSVVISAYNRSGLLRRALESLVSQTDDDWEAIVVDDGSTDDTSQVILPYLKSYRNITFFKMEHRGEVPTKNTGIMAAKGKYITLLDSDDEYDPYHLETRKEILLKNPDIELLYGGVTIIGDPYVPDRFDHRAKIHLKDCVIGGTFFIGRDLFQSLNGFNIVPMGSDADLFDRLKEKKIVMLKTDIPTYIYHRETPDSMTNKMLRGN